MTFTFTVGDTVVYPHHGAATIKAIEQKTVNETTTNILVLQINQGDLIVRVPADNVDLVGVRNAISDHDLDNVFAILQQKHIDEPENWSRRYKANQEKIASGDITRVAEVVRDLHRRECNRGLSTGEKSMFTKARTILISEIALVNNTNHDTAETRLNKALAA